MEDAAALLKGAPLFSYSQETTILIFLMIAVSKHLCYAKHIRETHSHLLCL